MPQVPAKELSHLGTAARKRQLAGWATVAGGFLALFLTGHFAYSFGVLVKPMIDMFGWSRADISSIVSVRALVTAVISPVAGTLADRYGSRRMILLGIFLFGLGYFLASRATSLWQYYLTFGLLTGISNGIVLMPVVTSVTKWFGGKSARANGIVSAGMSIAQTVFPVVVAYLIPRYGWESSLIILAIAIWICGMLSWAFIKNPQPVTPNPVPVISGQPGGSTEFTLREAIRTRSFWTMFCIFFISALCFQMVVVHIVVAAVDLGMAVGAAAVILSVMGVSSTFGRVVLSGLADRFGARALIAVSLVLQAAALFVLAITTNTEFFFVTAVLFGLVYGCFMPVMPALTGVFFGTRFVGAIFGTVNTAYVLGAAIGPFLAGYLFDMMGNYYVAFVIGATLAGSGFLLCLTLRQPRKRVV